MDTSTLVLDRPHRVADDVEHEMQRMYFSMPATGTISPAVVFQPQAGCRDLTRCARPPPHHVDWHKLKTMYRISTQEWEEHVRLQAILEFIEEYVAACWVEKRLFNFENAHMMQFVKEIYVVYTGEIMPIEQRRSFAMEMLSQNREYTRFLIAYLNTTVEEAQPVGSAPNCGAPDVGDGDEELAEQPPGDQEMAAEVTHDERAAGSQGATPIRDYLVNQGYLRNEDSYYGEEAPGTRTEVDS